MFRRQHHDKHRNENKSRNVWIGKMLIFFFLNINFNSKLLRNRCNEVHLRTAKGGGLRRRRRQGDRQVLLPLLSGTREPSGYSPTPGLPAPHVSLIAIGSAAAQCVARGGSAVPLEEGGDVTSCLVTIPRVNLRTATLAPQTDSSVLLNTSPLDILPSCTDTSPHSLTC